MRVYVVDRCGLLWAVYDSYGVKVSAAAERDAALTTCDNMNAEARRRATERHRPCMCCGATFRSEGVWNRLCDACNRVGRQMVG